MNQFEIRLLKALKEAQLPPEKLSDKDVWTPDLRNIGSKDDPRCPRCHAPESNPFKKNSVFIRAYKLDNRSQCLVCAGYYDPETLEYNQENGDPRAGWFLHWVFVD